jgi:hypothetical protein
MRHAPRDWFLALAVTGMLATGVVDGNTIKGKTVNMMGQVLGSVKVEAFCTSGGGSLNSTTSDPTTGAFTLAVNSAACPGGTQDVILKFTRKGSPIGAWQKTITSVDPTPDPLTLPQDVKIPAIGSAPVSVTYPTVNLLFDEETGGARQAP